MTWPTSMFFKIHDMTQCILCVEIYIINISQCHNIFNVLYVVKPALNTVCALYIYWNITQRDAGNQLHAFSMWVYPIFYDFIASYCTKPFFSPFFFLFSCLLSCFLASLLTFFFFFPCFFFFLFSCSFSCFYFCFSWTRQMLLNKQEQTSYFLLFTFLLAMPLNQVAPSRVQVWLYWPCL